MKKSVRMFLGGMGLACIVALPMALAGPREDGVAAYVRGDYATALKLLRPLADQGDAGGQFHLGRMYYTGYGVPQGYAEAVKWFRKAAEQGFALAQHNLGDMYYLGQGVPQHFVLAHKWYNLAATRYRFPEKEPTNRNELIKRRDLVAAKMTPAQIAEAQKLAREWKPK
ncbi:MAG: tetratricopeptide repeat protein [Alphaproteobacteria bacterium]